ncbi:hypothetical protein [Streptomyces genisteinicus]|uniref:Lipoprotein n=1 Tax=Streptomyces genisteinicus TaxID=2768068 RepID=A0A7H0HNS3_9ACTN|nr:hypothetical protein [Streptomyces genisteinicus]QNP62189.1 hypothetical protein IAG43_04085 [Streptomyces genisteinicus]
MQRTKTTAGTILTVLAAWATAGCVSVPAGPPPSPAPAPASPAPRQAAGPQILPGPARQALEAALPEPAAVPAGRPGRPAAAGRTTSPAAAGQSTAPPRSTPPERAAPAPPHLPHVPGLRLPRGREDVCGLGESLGGLRPGSAEARACREGHVR